MSTSTACATCRRSRTWPSGTSTGSASRSRTTSWSRYIKAVAVVRDLFFVARIRETARLVGTPLVFARTPEELATALQGEPPALVILDLTTNGWDYEAIFTALERVPAAPVLGYTTHALAGTTQPLHARCRRVVTKETLTKELPELLQRGLAA